MTNDVQLTGTQTVDGDIIINGVSLKQFIATHNHNYLDDGKTLVSLPPNPL